MSLSLVVKPSLHINNPIYKNYLKPTTATLQGNEVRICFCLHCVTVNNNNKNNLFFCQKHFFHEHLIILDKVLKLTQVAKNHFAFATALLWH
jgi:hypothetical protein